jgi:hypothetical protein
MCISLIVLMGSSYQDVWIVLDSISRSKRRVEEAWWKDQHESACMISLYFR